MKLITEQNFDTSFLTENVDGEKSYYLEGVFMQAAKRNRNGRIYEKSILKDAVDQYIDEQIKTGRAVGELNHPSTPTVNYKEVSHKIESLDWDGNDIIGKAKILNTPNGNIVKGLLDGGVQLGVSSRGMGSVTRKESIDYVNKDFVLNTVDIVQDPSAPSAFVNGIMEGVEWIKENGQYVRKEEIEEQIEEAIESSASINESNKYLALRQFLKTF